MHAPAPPPPRAGFREFVVLAAAMMALGALGVDMMLPALPDIAGELHAGAANRQQLVITTYLIGLGAGQLVHGPLSDRYGRKPVLAGSIAACLVANLVATAAGSFELLLAARLLGGFAVAATRVVTTAVVRDRYVGRTMARVMSLVGIVFMIAPVLAPTLGAGILVLGPWRAIFGVIAALCALVLGWLLLRLPETLQPWDRLPLSPRRLYASWRTTLTDRYSLGYTLASTMMQGGILAYVTTVQQIVAETFGRPRLLNLVFGATAGMLMAANLVNSRFVVRLGTRLISHVAVIALIALAIAGCALSVSGAETLLTFVVLQGLVLGCIGLTGSNFGAMAMENMGAIAGTASSVQGFIAVTGGALIALLIGQAFDGTTLPLHLGSLAVGVAALIVVALVEKGRLFRAR